MVGHFVFRLRQRYFDAIVSGEKSVEYRRANPFWFKRVLNILKKYGVNVGSTSEGITFYVEGVIGVCICGKRSHRRKVHGITLSVTPDNFSAQGKKDVNTPFCFGFLLGEEVLIKTVQNEREKV